MIQTFLSDILHLAHEMEYIFFLTHVHIIPLNLNLINTKINIFSKIPFRFGVESSSTGNPSGMNISTISFSPFWPR